MLNMNNSTKIKFLNTSYTSLVTSESQCIIVLNLKYMIKYFIKKKTIRFMLFIHI